MACRIWGQASCLKKAIDATMHLEQEFLHLRAAEIKGGPLQFTFALDCPQKTETCKFATLGRGRSCTVAKKRVNRYPKAFRLMALERMKSCDNVSELARELNVDRSVLYHWRDQLA